ncbi:hypothetical protein DOTSEDRAFT_68436 [Dothistroma septosporum NZE10]|uniref:Uncharacterized protein n=1 Tax=Dothistroma septosporum (strain NZE10 / CBS 128990) TaxID=675120 RepID=N1Q366_DOTSN|nr:hypothetical protein DOTSEDRAFT_68436 [Dothistroma septosporum NZE10]
MTVSTLEFFCRRSGTQASTLDCGNHGLILPKHSRLSQRASSTVCILLTLRSRVYRCSQIRVRDSLFLVTVAPRTDPLLSHQKT